MAQTAKELQNGRNLKARSITNPLFSKFAGGWSRSAWQNPGENPAQCWRWRGSNFELSTPLL